MENNIAPVKVAHVIGKMVGGGVESVVINYCKNIDKTKVQFDFLIDSDSTYIPHDELNKLGNIIIIPPYQNIFTYCKELKKIFKKNKYDIVHSHINTLSFIPLYIAKKSKIQIRIAHSHSTSNKKEWKKNIIKNILRPFSKIFATHYFSCSEYAGRYLFGNKTFNEGKVSVINNAIDIDKFLYNEDIRKQKRKELGLNDQLVIGHVGRFIPQKNHIRLLEIFKSITENYDKNTVLLLIGDGYLKDTVKDKVKELGLENNVMFLGQRTDVNELMQAMDIFLLPSLYEGLPVVGVEAQASGLLCILSSAMTNETKVLSSTKFVSLEDDNNTWAKIIMDSYANHNRVNTYDEIVNAKFEIKTEAKRLENKYISLSKKKIFFIVNTNVFSGAESVNINIINNLKNKYDFYWVSHKGIINEYLSLYNINYIEIKKVNIKEIRRVIKEYKPDILHATDYKASVICSLVSKNTPIISHLHNNSPWLNKLNLNSISYLFAGLRSKLILTVSDSIKDEYIFSKFIKNKIINISNPVSRDIVLSKIDPKDRKQYDICFVGRLTTPKDPIRFIKLIYEIKKSIPNIKTILVGDGELRGECEDLISKLKLKDNVELVGFQTNPYKYMNQSKIFLLPSKWEGYGLVVFEALTLGLPCLVTKVGGMINIVNDTCGKFCNNDEEFKDMVINLLKDKKLYKELSNGAIIRSKELDNSNTYYSKLDELYKIVK